MMPPAQPLLVTPLRLARRLRNGLTYLGAAVVIGTLALLLIPPLRAAVRSALAPPIVSTATGEPAEVRAVLDGDTFVLADGRSVRILGIDAPEIHNANMDHEQPFGDEAAARLTSLLGRHSIRLEVDAEDKDHYGRLLRHVWSDDKLVAEVLAREGLAYALTVAPSVRYAGRIRAAEAEARAASRGLWSVAHPTLPVPGAGLPAAAPAASAPALPSADASALGAAAGSSGASPGASSLPCGARVPGAIPAESAGDFVDTFQAVEFKVVQSRDTGKITYLNSRVPFQGTFYVAIFPDLYGDFPSPPAVYFRGQCVLAQGTIQMYKGSPQLVIHRADDIKIVGP